MDRSTSLTNAYTQAYAENATWYWEAVSAANQHAIDYLRALTDIAWRANPIIALAPVLEQNGRRMNDRMQETLRDLRRDGDDMEHETAQHERQTAPKRTNGAVHHNGRSGRKTAATRGRGRHS